MVTLSVEECENMMVDILSLKTSMIYTHDIIDENVSDEVLEGYICLLTNEDRNLLVEYAPKLFDTLPSPDDLYGICLELAGMLGGYRLSVQHKNDRIEYNKLLTRSDGYSKKKRVESLRGHIKGVLEFVGDYKHSYMHDVRNPLIEELKKAYANPAEYITHKKEKVVPNKAPIRNYLNSLKLPTKTNVIKDFIMQIDTNTSPLFITLN